MLIEFEGKMIFWRGPAPYMFVCIPDEPSQLIKNISSVVSYGWGAIPVVARVGDTEWRTSLFPKNGKYLVPIRASVQEAERLKLDDDVHVHLIIILPTGA